MRKTRWTVGVLARMLGVTPDSIRHYERIGILPPAERSPSGYRVWDPHAVEYIKWIASTKRAGFTLSELAKIFQMYRSGIAPCRDVRDLLTQKQMDLDAQIAELLVLRRKLKGVLARWNTRLRHTAAGEFVPLLDDLGEFHLLSTRKPHNLLNRRRDTMINTLVHFYVQPEKVNEFETTHRKLVGLMRDQPGCIEIKAHRSVDNPLEYAVYGTWESKEAWNRAHQSTQFKRLFKNLPIVDHTLSRASFFKLVYTATTQD
ncbi:MAG: antibiotic biosynthesis monooxygenase [Desulfomonile tiedjei]|nr:antibiotic biosynthesis monooxygenase [Desulfomonile tiedjei]